MKNDFAFIGGIFGSLILIMLLFAWATKDATTINDLTCERRGVVITTTMRELRKPGPYVIGELEDGRIVAIPKDGINCEVE